MESLQDNRVIVNFVGIQLDASNRPAFVMVNEASGTTVAYDPEKHLIEGMSHEQAWAKIVDASRVLAEVKS